MISRRWLELLYISEKLDLNWTLNVFNFIHFFKLNSQFRGLQIVTIWRVNYAPLLFKGGVFSMNTNTQ